MDIHGVDTLIIIQNLSFLVQLIMEGMQLAMANYMNHQLLHNLLLWNTDFIIVTHLSYSDQELHAMIKVLPNHKT